MASDNEDKNARVEIEKTLAAVRSTILEINQEVKTIKNLVNSSGELHRTMLTSMDKLNEEAESLGINMKDTINNVEKDLFRISTEPINAVDKLLSDAVNH